MNPSSTADGTGRRELPGSAFLLPPLLLAATLTGAVFVLRGPDHIFGWALAIVVGIAALWILTSALFPAAADRTCPECGRVSLERLDPSSTEGLVCRRCSWVDETASAFLLAEDDGVEIEPMVLRARDARAARATRDRPARPARPQAPDRT